jgi:hypothetical protein
VKDTTIDYTVPENYSIQWFSGHKIKSNDEGIQLVKGPLKRNGGQWRCAM